MAAELGTQVRHLGLAHITADLQSYNRLNKTISYGLAAYVAMALFSIISTVSTPITLSIVAGYYVVFADQQEKKMAVPLMLSIMMRWIFGSTVAIALAFIGAVGVGMKNNRGISKTGGGAIAATLLSMAPMPIALLMLALSGLVLMTAFQRRAQFARRIQPLKVFQEEETQLPSSQVTFTPLGDARPVLQLSRIEGYLIDAQPVVEIAQINQFDGGPQLPDQALQSLIGKANDRTEVDAARESLMRARQYALAGAGALVVGALTPTIAFLGIAAAAIYYEHYNMSLGFMSVAGLEYLLGMNPTLLLLSAAAISAYTGKGAAAIPMIITAVAAILLFKVAMGALAAGIILSVPYVAYSMKELEHAERYITTADTLVEGGDARIHKQGDTFVYVQTNQPVVGTTGRVERSLFRRWTDALGVTRTRRIRDAIAV